MDIEQAIKIVEWHFATSGFPLEHEDTVTIHMLKRPRIVVELHQIEWHQFEVFQVEKLEHMVVKPMPSPMVGLHVKATYDEFVIYPEHYDDLSELPIYASGEIESFCVIEKLINSRKGTPMTNQPKAIIAVNQYHFKAICKQNGWNMTQVRYVQSYSKNALERLAGLTRRDVYDEVGMLPELSDSNANVPVTFFIVE